MLYVYYVLLFPRNYPRWMQLLLCFAMGIVVDMFNNTPGLAAASLTLAGFMQPYLLELFLRKDDAPELSPSIANMGVGRFCCYAVAVMLVFCLTFFLLEAFSFHYWLECIIGCAGSLLLTFILVFTIDILRK